jgi:hypothetical protein
MQVPRLGKAHIVANVENTARVENAGVRVDVATLFCCQ